ncbi:MAG: hypothetical protein AAF840_11870, partial [Bacteroidota bacterium]
LQPFSLGLQVSPELGYRLSDRTTLLLRPGFTWSRQNLEDNTVVKMSRFWGKAGIRFSIK